MSSIEQDMAQNAVAGHEKRTPLTAVVDIGSNSVRMVVFQVPGGERGAVSADGPDGVSGRVLEPVSNERVLCGLGRGLGRDKAFGAGEGSPRLDPGGVKVALSHIRRFAEIGAAMGVSHWEVLATEAVRTADDGDGFVAQVRDIIGVPVAILSGEEEAEAAALGVVSGIPDADGMMGDLGGGSLEIVALNKGVPGRQATLPLGALRLDGIVGRDVNKARALVEHTLAQVDWLDAVRGRNFYPVGGAWRAFAGLHMAHTNYPLRVIHEYSLSRQETLNVLELVGGLGPESLGQIPGISKSRLATLPLAAVVMERLLLKAMPGRIVFSAQGLREGWLYRKLPPAVRALDPLIAGCAGWERRVSRFGSMGESLARWIAPLFVGEEPPHARLRRAAAMLADTGWRDHPDYRADGGFARVLHMPLSGITHPERVTLAFAVSARYGGGTDGALKDRLKPLIGEYALDQAMLVGRALRFAQSLSGGVGGILEDSRLELGHQELTLFLPAGRDHLISDVCRRRFTALARRLGRKPVVASI